MSARENDHVGYIYTAQGFDFDYVRVIVRPDLVAHLDVVKRLICVGD